MMIDPIRMNCASCVWWKREGARLATATRDPSCAQDVGTCHAHSPVPFQIDAVFPVTIWPTTHESRFCGDWQGISGGSGDGGERIIAFPSPANRIAA